MTCGVWNAHRIRLSKDINVPSGIPDVMYMAPHLWSVEECPFPLTEDLTSRKRSFTFLRSVPCDVLDLCTMVMKESGLEFPSSISQAFNLYFQMKDICQQLFEPI